MDLEAWEGDDEMDDGFLLADERGWSVEQMFQANDVLGVKSTFDENMGQYATAAVQGSAEDLKRAERIAQEISSSVASKARAQLENDDEERDLDKETLEPFQVRIRIFIPFRNGVIGLPEFASNPNFQLFRQEIADPTFYISVYEAAYMKQKHQVFERHRCRTEWVL
ncbi:unnamed protein product [Gongylonema pulchrum]|uniref:LsmAD domain-containing protein n=1 Tax=Gongylonema pulchrum TaxID=637853 RepID=A0A3P7QZA7_9BILA|nr:unnamed protein product [Gongylonema pulchrum]